MDIEKWFEKWIARTPVTTQKIVNMVWALGSLIYTRSNL